MTEFNYDTNEIECAHCGEHFYYELTTCPHCNTPVYPDETLTAPPPRPPLHPPDDQADIATALASVIGIGLGALAVSLTGYFVLRGLIADELARQLLRVGLIAIVTAAASFAVTRLTRTSKALLGLSFGMWGIGIDLALIAADVSLLEAENFTLIQVSGWGLYLLAGYVSGRAALGDLPKTRQAAEEAELQKLFYFPPEHELYHDLLAKVRFDEDTVERLVEYERTLTPNASRAYLLQAAIKRWERDNS